MSSFGSMILRNQDTMILRTYILICSFVNTLLTELLFSSGNQVFLRMSTETCEACKLPAECPAIVGMMLILIHEVLVPKEIL
jgi:hypothetical protein